MRQKANTRGGEDVRQVPQSTSSGLLAVGRCEIGKSHAQDLATGKALAAIERSREYVEEGCSSALEWAVRNGMDQDRARWLLALGRVVTVLPEVGDDVAAREMTPETAAVVGRVVPKTPTIPPKRPPSPEEQAERDARVRDRARYFHGHAKRVSKSQLVEDIRTDDERIAQGGPVVALRFHVSAEARKRWHVARKIARRRARGRRLTEGEAFVEVTERPGAVRG